MPKMWKKFKTRGLAVVVSIAIDLLMLTIYIVCIRMLENQDLQNRALIDVISNTLLVGISILTTSLISIPFIEVRDRNKLCDELLLGDVLSLPQTFDVLSAGKKEEMLQSLECNLHFDNCAPKESMIHSIREKIVAKTSDKEENELRCFYESCEYEIECSFQDGCIKKSITKTIDVRAYEEASIPHFQLCKSAFEEADHPYSTVEYLNVNGNEKNVKDSIIECGDGENGVFSEKSGYHKLKKYCYANSLHVYPDKPCKVVIAYSTNVPKSDIAFSCRLNVPCHKFKCRFKLTGPGTENYNINMNAFGFWDDAKTTPNRPDKSEVKVTFDNWIFPGDGVAVALLRQDIEQKVEKTLTVSKYFATLPRIP